MPVYNSAGLSDAKIPDVQAGYEKGITGLAAALAGANYIHHSAGLLESMLSVAYEQYVIDDDINGSVMRMVRGIEVTDETLITWTSSSKYVVEKGTTWARRKAWRS